ncbi:MAG: biotin--[acetyl-CoA-carboxylase] ligase [Pseudomonadota bacterium]
MSSSRTLGALAWPDAVGRIVLPRVDSTMAEAARRVGDITEPTWIMAGAQTAARGRQGRVWRAPPGNFAATLVMRPTGDAEAAALRSFVAALALFDALSGLTGRADAFALKWPNDVLLHGGKVAGILLERLGDGALLVGIGVNLAAAPSAAEVEAGAVRPASLRDALQVEIAPAECLDALAGVFAAREAALAAEGFARIREAWLARAARLGQPIRARVGPDEYQGTFETIDAAGHLVLLTAAGRQTIPAADVYF